MTVAKDVVQFLMDLFGNRQAAQDFLDDPERVLSDHGLGGVSSADVDAAMPVVLDYAPLSVNASNFDRDFGAGGNSAGAGHLSGVWTPLPAAGGHDDHGQAVEQLAHVVASYSYPSARDDRDSALDDRDSVMDESTRNIWADGDVEQWFDNDAAVAFGAPAGGAGKEMGFADTRIDDFFNLDADTDAHADADVENAVLMANQGNVIEDSFNEDTFVEADDSELTFIQDNPAIDIDNDIDDADAEEAADFLEFDS